MKIRDRIKEFRRVPASELAPNPKNWRTHSKKQADALRGILAEIGFAGAVLARELPDGTLQLIDGHLRAETVGKGTEIPVLILDVNETEAATLLATFDPIGSMAGSDQAKLEELLRDVKTESAAVTEMLEEVAKAAGAVFGGGKLAPGGGGDEFDATPEDKGPTRTQVGDLWNIGNRHRLLVGDCTIEENVTRLMAGKTAEMVWTDPPYGVSIGDKNKMLNAMAFCHRIEENLQNDSLDEPELAAMLAACFGIAAKYCTAGAAWYVAAPAVPLHLLFAGAMKHLGILRQMIIWVKNNSTFSPMGVSYHWQHEPIFYGWLPNGGHRYHGDRKQTTVWNFDRPQKSPDHPTMKPLELVQQAIEHSSIKDEIVYDCFLGSGTTLIASHRLGRICYGCEIEPRYADVILKRAEAEGLTCVREETQ